jgi:conjugal transfer ATP-binding protein TraC
MNLLKRIFGNGGLTSTELKKAPDTSLFYNIDDTVGFIWECTPLCFAGEKSLHVLNGIFRTGLPEGSVVQFILYSDPNINHILDSSQSKKKRNSELIQKALLNYAKFITGGSDGLDQNSGIPIRNFRLFVSVKIPKSKLNEININDVRRAFEEILHGINLYPVLMDAEDLLDWARRFMNSTCSEVNNFHYSDDMPLNRQVLLADTGIDVVSGEELKVGSKYMRCITPKILPKEVDELTMNEVMGGIWGLTSDFEQITSTFMCTVNVVVKNVKKSIETKINTTLAQKASGSFIYKLERRQDEFKKLSREFDEKSYLLVMPIVWIWSNDRDKTMKDTLRARRIWDSKGFLMQNDSYIQNVLLISSLPLGLYNVKGNVDFIGRSYIISDDIVSYLLPTQGDFMGYGSSLLFLGRKGQLCGIDIFSDRASNYNMLITAGSGKGKSFLLNYILFNAFSEGGIIRVIDIGGSYKKMVAQCGARYLDLADKSVCLNPFTNIKNDDTQELHYMLNSVAAVVLQMCFFGSDSRNIKESEFTLAKEAVKYAWTNAANEANIDLVWDYLRRFKHYAPKLEICEDNKCAEELEQLAGIMAFNLRDFTSQGTYGDFFNKTSTFDIKSDEFVVLELETLKRVKDLFKIVTLIVLDETTRDLYLSDRVTPRYVMIDEAYQFLGDSSIQRSVIEEGYRRSRKYRGSFGVVLQSVLDLQRFGDVGSVINANSSFKFYLESSDIEKAQHEKLLDYSSFELAQLKSIKSNLPHYSEIFLDSPYGRGVLRLIMDAYNYYIYTSNPKDIAKIEDLVRQGKNYDKAIESLI